MDVNDTAIGIDMNQRESDYLFEELSRGFLQEHARNLSVFRYIRAYGGHVGDSDKVEACFLYSDEKDLLLKINALGISYRSHAVKPPQPIPGVPYPGDEYLRFPSLIVGTQWVEQPGWCSINGEKVFVWCHPSTISVSVNESQRVVLEDFHKARRLEAHLAPLRLAYLDPPLDNWHCICPQHHPVLFA